MKTLPRASDFAVPNELIAYLTALENALQERDARILQLEKQISNLAATGNTAQRLTGIPILQRPTRRT